MPYAIRYNSNGCLGTLVEMPIAELLAAEAAQDEARERFEAYFDTPECDRPHGRPPEHPYPHFEGIDASRAHKWVRDGWIHETALYIDTDGRIRRASDGEA